MERFVVIANHVKGSSLNISTIEGSHLDQRQFDVRKVAVKRRYGAQGKEGSLGVRLWLRSAAWVQDIWNWVV